MSDDQQSFAETQIQQLREHYNELAALAGSLAPEIKNPLSVIRMNADLLGEAVADGKKPALVRGTLLEVTPTAGAVLSSLGLDVPGARPRPVHAPPGGRGRMPGLRAIECTCKGKPCSRAAFNFRRP